MGNQGSSYYCRRDQAHFQDILCISQVHLISPFALLRRVSYSQYGASAAIEQQGGILSTTGEIRLVLKERQALRARKKKVTEVLELCQAGNTPLLDLHCNRKLQI